MAGDDPYEDAQQAPPAQVTAVSVKLPPFWPRQPGMWFVTVEAQFNLRRVTEDQTKFDHVLTALDPDTQERVADFFDVLPAVGSRYKAFKARVLASFEICVQQRLDTLVKLTIGDDTPTRLLDRMLGLYRPDPDATKNPLFR